jgi:hypothetical protein
MSNLYDVLEICLQDIDQGMDIDTVLFRYPDLADELRPILEASAQAKSIASPEPSSDMVRRNRAKVLQQAAEMRETMVQPSRRVWSVPLRRVMVTLFVVVALFVSSTNLVRAASTTVPGDNLYPVKRTWEDVLVLFTFNMQAREALEVAHENERLEELYEVFAEGRSEEVDFAGVVTRQNGDLWLVSKIPVVISAQTDIRAQSVAVGDAVRVRGVTQADGTVLAERLDALAAGVPLPEVDDDDAPEIEQEGSENENESIDDHSGEGSGGETTKTPEAKFERKDVSIQGVVDSVNGSILIINGLTMDIRNAEVKGTPTAGSAVKVEGYYDANGNFIVTKIEFKDSSSGSDDDGNNDSSGDDNGGDDNSNDDSSDDNSNDDHSGGDDNSGSGGGDD